jgi:hypothetical protein
MQMQALTSLYRQPKKRDFTKARASVCHRVRVVVYGPIVTYGISVISGWLLHLLANLGISLTVAPLPRRGSGEHRSDKSHRSGTFLY